MRPKFKKNRGFTLFEIIIGVMIFCIIAVIVGSVFASHYKIYDLTSAEGDLKALNLTILERISKVAVESKSIAASHTFGTAALISSSSTVVFELPAIDAAKNIIVGSFDYIAFLKSPTSTKVLEYVDAAAGSARASGTKILSTFVKNLIFSYNNSVAGDSTAVKILLEIEKTIRGAAKDFGNSTTVYLRNK